MCYPGFSTTPEKFFSLFEEDYPTSAGHYATMTKAQWEYVGIATYGTEGQFWVVLTYSV